jgi:UDP-GlcNAc:undecaprenyl-phosphate GlcNAc-1-phosphate transferase
MVELLFFLEALAVSYILTGGILRYSLERSLLDVPNVRSSHSVPKPRLGGVAIVLAFYCSCATLLLVGINPFPGIRMTVGVLSAGAVIACIGLADDLRGLNARVKLITQISAGAIVISSGVVLEQLHIPLIGSLELGAMSVPFTLLWIVGFINLYNFIDGIDGLAAGVGMIAAVFSLLVGVLTGATFLAPLYAILAGSSLGFLRYNFPPARIFMGDTGSTFIGFVFATLSVIGAGAGLPVFVTVLLLGGVIGDAVLTLLRRVVKRERLLAPHRTHYYQRLTSLGLSHKQVTLLEYLVAVLLGVSALFYFHGDRLFVSVFSVVWVGFFLWAITKIRSMERGGRLFWEGRTLAVALGDIIFIAASYFLSYYLRLNFRFPEAETTSMLISLPIVLVIRTAVFFYFDLYRRVWRYTSLDDLMRIVKAVSLSSLVMIVSFTLLFRFESFPRSVFIIDWFILTVFLAGSRIATRWFHELPSHEEIAGKRVVIGGAGHATEALLHRIKKAEGVEPVGIIDDRSEMAGRVVHGLEVLGPFTRLAHLAQFYRIEEIILLDTFRDRFPADQRQALRDMGVTVRVVTDGTLLPDHPSALGALSGERVLVAGNGPLVEASPSAFSRAGKLVIVSNESRIISESRRLAGSAPCTVLHYLGALSRRRDIEEILRAHEPEVVVVDTRFDPSGLGNPLGAYLATVFFPLVRIATAAARSPDVRFITIRRGVAVQRGGPLEKVVAAAGHVLRLIFRSDPARCFIISCRGLENDMHMIEALDTVLACEGGDFNLAPGHSTGTVGIERISSPETPPGAEEYLRELLMSCEEADERRTIDIIRNITDGSVVRGHDR